MGKHDDDETTRAVESRQPIQTAAARAGVRSAERGHLVNALSNRQWLRDASTAEVESDPWLDKLMNDATGRGLAAVTLAVLAVARDALAQLEAVFAALIALCESSAVIMLDAADRPPESDTACSAPTLVRTLDCAPGAPSLAFAA